MAAISPGVQQKILQDRQKMTLDERQVQALENIADEMPAYVNTMKRLQSALTKIADQLEKQQSN